MRWGFRSGVRALGAGSLIPGVIFWATGCGGGGGNGTGGPPGCLQVQPCGGDVVGTWRVVGGCVNAAALTAVAQCPAWMISAGLDVSGTLTFNGDLSYAFNIAETITTSQSIPLSCTSFSSCADVQADLAAASPTSAATCTGSTTCACHSTLSIPSTAINGTYTTSGTMLQLTSATSSVTTDVFCVQGSTLHLMGIDHSTGQTVVIVDDVAQKQ
jgi:hypothetical protein